MKFISKIVKQLTTGVILCASLAVAQTYTLQSLNKAVVASGEESQYQKAANVNDGDITTRWSSRHMNWEWVQIDLGSDQSIDKIVLNWEAAFATEYNVFVGKEGVSGWGDLVYTKTGGQGGIETLIQSFGTGRYITIQGIQRSWVSGVQYGISLWELQVYSKDGDQVLWLGELDAYPTLSSEGDAFFHTTLNESFIFNNEIWEQFAVGETGATGPQGIQGIQGDAGIQGLIGPQGLQGDLGLQGETGLQGVQGDAGIQGLIGSQGLQGIQGLQGEIGSQGPQGIQGETGAQGDDKWTQEGSAIYYNEGSVLDQASEDMCCGNYGIGFGASKYWQSFTAGLTGPLSKVEVYVSTFTGSVELRIYEGEGVSGTLLHSQTVSATTEYDWNAFSISNEILVTAGSVYSVQLFSNASSAALWWKIGSGYAGGTSGSDGGIYDFTFRTHIGTTGSVGINTTTPAGALDVVGSIAINGSEIINALGQWTGDPTGLIGPQGAQGLQGEIGIQGIQGEIGVQGSQGLQGETGVQGSQGDQGIQGNVGAQGPQGDQGVQGDEGAQGAQGVQGVQGDVGAQGSQGDQGIQGDTGLQGLAGPVGGSNKQVAFNDNGSVAGSDIYYDNTTTNVGVGIDQPLSKLQVVGSIQLSSDNGACDATKAGTIRWTGAKFEGCNGSQWLQMGFVPPLYTYGYTDLATNSALTQSLYDFFSSVNGAVTSTDYLLFEITGSSTDDGAICSERADWYVSSYLANATAHTTVTSGTWSRWTQAEGGAWSGAVTTASDNDYGVGTSTADYSWCIDKAIGGKNLCTAPGDADDSELFVNGATGTDYTLTIKVGANRMAVCGF
ncbi:MAG: discoidin domain-containing protein [Reichenbachiella sp.]